MDFEFAQVVQMHANQLVPQLLRKQSDTLPTQYDTLNICMMKFGAKKLIFGKMTAL